MKVFVNSNTGHSLGLAMRFESDNHDVRFLCPNETGLGFVKLFDHKEEWHPDVVVYDSNDKAAEADSLRAQGMKVLGPSKWSAMLEKDKSYAKSITTSLGWNNPTSKDGVNLYVSGWFNGVKFINKYSSLVYRRFMNGGIGPDLECTGVLTDFKGVTDKTRKRIFDPLEKILKKVNHRGVVHVHLILKENDIEIAEINTSLVHPLSFVTFENISVSSSDFLLKLFNESSETVANNERWGMLVSVTTPPYPYNKMKEPVEINGIAPEALKHMWPCEMVKVNNRVFVQGGGHLGYITTRGKHFIDPQGRVSEHNECIRRVYRTVKNLTGADFQYRNDIGTKVGYVIQRLRQSGWLAE